MWTLISVTESRSTHSWPWAPFAADECSYFLPPTQVGWCSQMNLWVTGADHCSGGRKTWEVWWLTESIWVSTPQEKDLNNAGGWGARSRRMDGSSKEDNWWSVLWVTEDPMLWARELAVIEERPRRGCLVSVWLTGCNQPFAWGDSHTKGYSKGGKCWGEHQW